MEWVALANPSRFLVLAERLLPWLAAATAAGLDLGRDFIEKQAVERIVPRIIDRIAVKVGTEVAEKWSARVIPVLSAGAGGKALLARRAGASLEPRGAGALVPRAGGQAGPAICAGVPVVTLQLLGARRLG